MAHPASRASDGDASSAKAQHEERGDGSRDPDPGDDYEEHHDRRTVIHVFGVSGMREALRFDVFRP